MRHKRDIYGINYREIIYRTVQNLDDAFYIRYIRFGFMLKIGFAREEIKWLSDSWNKALYVRHKMRW